MYSLKDTKTPTKNTMWMILVNIIVSVGSSRFLGLNGLALGTTVAAYFGAVLLFYNLKKKIGEFSKMNHLIVETLKIAAASIIMGIGVYFTNNALVNSFGSKKAMFVAILVGALIYAVLVMVFKVKEAENLIRQIKSKVKSKKQ